MGLIFALCAGITLIIRRTRQETPLPLFFTAALVSCLLFLFFGADKLNAQSLTGENVSVKATVCEAPYRKDKSARHYVVCEIEEVGGERLKGRIRLSFSPTNDGIDPDELVIGNTLSFTGRVYIPGEGDKSIERYFQGENILLGAYGAKNLTVTEPKARGITYYFYLIRSYATDTLSYAFSDKVAGVLVGILTGDKSCLDGELYEAFRESGVAHLMAVSGIHLSVWVFFLGGVIPEGRKSSRLKYLLLLVATVFIMLLAGMSESIKRAGFMSVIYLLGKLGKRRSDSLNSLGFAVFLMLLYNQSSVLSLSFQLTVLSTLSILTLGKAYMKSGNRFFGTSEGIGLLRSLGHLSFDSFCISICVLVFTCVVLIYSFGGISTVSAWTNILLIPITTPLLVLTGAYVVLSPLTAVSYPIAVVIDLMTDYLVLVTKSLAGVRNAFLPFNSDTLPLYLAGAVMIALFSFLLLKRDSVHKLKVVVASLVVCVGLIAFYEASEDKLIIYIDVIDGETVCAVENEGRAVLIGEIPSYEKDIFISNLEEKGISVLGQMTENDALSLRSLADGKRLEADNLWKGFELKKQGDGLLVEFYDRKISLFAREGLQEEDNCDIIAEIYENEEQDILLRVKDEVFSLYEHGSLSLVVKRRSDCLVRGENSWRNLMKNN